MTRLWPHALAALVALGAFTAAARADATLDPQASKIDGVRPDKLPLVGKVKECCGYPIGVKEDFRLSFYWLAYESEYANEPYDVDIYTRHGFFIGRFPSAFVYELKLEGSGILRDGRVLNYDGECNYGMGTCFKTLELAEHPLGAGVQGRSLEPFRSIAVDPHVIPIGAPVYVPELVGLELPDGTRHDGCLRADDMGGAIKQHKLDFFVESYFNFKFLELEQHPLGVGVQGRKLEPFRSVAVDPKMIPIGAPVFIPELAGLPMPDGSTHDGCVRADDQGGAIKNGKIDFFVESYFNFKFLADNLWWRLKATPHLEEPRCEYLRLHAPRERVNEQTDWAELHKRHAPLRMAEKVALRKIKRNRAIAQAWLKRHSAAAKGGHSAVAHKK
ncbi:MAG TPA: 3D domain-containing protein [Polyangia bacterium]|nr:3D domain-containing protein [Polyangia bacterium]